MVHRDLAVKAPLLVSWSRYILQKQNINKNWPIEVRCGAHITSKLYSVHMHACTVDCETVCLHILYLSYILKINCTVITILLVFRLE